VSSSTRALAICGLIVVILLSLTETPTVPNTSVSRPTATETDFGNPAFFKQTGLSFHSPTQISTSNPHCQSSMQNTYPAKAASGQKIVITTSITNVCMAPLDYNRVIVDIMLPNTAVILSTAPATPDAINTIIAPQQGGPWTIDVVASFSYYPLTGTLTSIQDTIIINISGPIASSTIKSLSALTTIAAPSTVNTGNSTTSNLVAVFVALPSKLLSTTNTPTAKPYSTNH